MNRYICRAKAVDDGRWVVGEPHTMCSTPHIHISLLESVRVNPNTIGMFTGWFDKKGKPIFEDDILALTIPDGTTRLFIVEWQRQVRHLAALKDFVPDGNPVEISGWCFTWGKNCLLPSVIGEVPDYNRMEIVGNVYDNRDLLEPGAEEKFHGQRELIGNTCCLSNKPGVQVFMYDLKDDNGSWLARCFLTSDGVYMSYSEWGNFFHYFAAPGKDGIRKFMLGISDGYFANKLCEVEWNTAPTKVAAAAKRHAKYVLPVLQQAIREQLEQEG